MYAIIKENLVIGTASFLPNSKDLNTRNESAVFYDSHVSIGDIYDNGQFYTPPILKTQDELLQEIKQKRNFLLSQSDKYILPDYPTGELTRDQWNVKVMEYRQTLREFPEKCDLENPIFPSL